VGVHHEHKGTQQNMKENSTTGTTERLDDTWHGVQTEGLYW